MKIINNKGFTLIELLVVISIVSMLSSVVYASLNGARDKSTVAAGQQFEASQYHAEGMNTVTSLNFDEGSGTIANDNSGLGSNAVITNVNGASIWSSDTPTNRGSSLLFDGTANIYATITNTGKFDIPTTYKSGYTYSIWIKPTVNRASMDVMGKTFSFIDLGGVGRKIRMTMLDTLPRLVTGATTVQLSKWHHIAGSYDSSGYLKVYLDGKLDGTAGPYGIPQALSGTDGHGDIHIGLIPASGDPFVGYMDNAKFYNHALSASEIGKIYAEGILERSVAVK